MTHVSCSCMELSATTGPNEASCNRCRMVEEAQVLGVEHTLESQRAACSHPGTDGACNHCPRAHLPLHNMRTPNSIRLACYITH